MKNIFKTPTGQFDKNFHSSFIHDPTPSVQDTSYFRQDHETVGHPTRNVKSNEKLQKTTRHFQKSTRHTKNETFFESEVHGSLLGFFSSKLDFQKFLLAAYKIR
jgi:hypothetical protein